jgi:hypothetical protein
MKYFFHILVLVAAFSLPSHAGAQMSNGTGVEGSESARIEAVTLTGEIAVDGVLDDPAWASAQWIALAWEVAPGENTAAPVSTECRLGHDGVRLYVSCRAEDAQPAGIRAYITDRDAIADQDRIVVLLDPFADGRRAYEFGISALGVQADAAVSQQGASQNGQSTLVRDASWDATWEAAGRRTATGYEVEVAVPFSALRFPRPDVARPWRVTLLRHWPRGSNVTLRSSPLDRSDGCELCQSLLLTGIDDVQPGGTVMLAPTLTASRTDMRSIDTEPGLEAGGLETALGLDGTWAVTSNLTAAFALNPDFSQVEADAAQLDANTRFALFFPEKRPFFLDGADLFATPIQAVFTRTVADPLIGARLTGKAGGTSVGIIAAHDEVNHLLLPGDQSSSAATLEGSARTGIVRLRRDVGASSSAGMLFTTRQGGGYRNHVIGADALLRPWPAVSANLQVLRTWTEYPDALAARYAQPDGPFAGNALRAIVRYAPRDWIVNADLSTRGRGVRLDAGFQPTVGYLARQATITRRFWGERGSWFTQLQLQGGAWRQDDTDGRILDGGLWAGITWQGPAQSYINFWDNFNVEVRYGDTVFPSSTRYLEAGMRPSGAIRLATSAEFGQTIDVRNGRGVDFTWIRPELELRLGARTHLRLSHALQRLTLAGEDVLRAQATDLRATYNFSTRSFLRATLVHRSTHYDEATNPADIAGKERRLFGQLLYAYKIDPRTVLYAGYSEDRDDLARALSADDALAPSGRSLFLKLGYAWRP